MLFFLQIVPLPPSHTKNKKLMQKNKNQEPMGVALIENWSTPISSTQLDDDGFIGFYVARTVSLTLCPREWLQSFLFDSPGLAKSVIPPLLSPCQPITLSPPSIFPLPSSIHPVHQSVSQCFRAVGSLAAFSATSSLIFLLHLFLLLLLPFCLSFFSLAHLLAVSHWPLLSLLLLSLPLPLLLPDLFCSPLLFFLHLYHWLGLCLMMVSVSLPPSLSVCPPPLLSICMLMNAVCRPVQLLRLVHFHIKCHSVAKVEWRSIFSRVLLVDIRETAGL